MKQLSKVGNSRAMILSATYLNELESKGKLLGFEINIDNNNATLIPVFEGNNVTATVPEVITSEPQIESVPNQKPCEQEALTVKDANVPFKPKWWSEDPEERVQRLAEMARTRD